MGDPARLDPTVAQDSERDWRLWLFGLAHAGRTQLAEFGVLLVLGFVFGLLALYAFSELSSEVMEQETQALDLAVLEWLHQYRSPALTLLMRGFSAMGSEVVTVALLVGLVWLGRQRRWGAAVSLLLVTAGAQLLNNVLKDLFQRARPSPVVALFAAQTFSFPSGHAMVSAAFYCFVAYLGWRLLRGWWRLAWVSGLALLVLLIGISRMYLGVHYLTDVVAGYIAGFIWTDTIIIGGHLLTRRIQRARPATDTR